MLKEIKEEVEYVKLDYYVGVPILSLKQIEWLIKEAEKVEQYEKALNEIDTHIRATSEPIPYIVETLKNTLPYYKVENYK